MIGDIDNTQYARYWYSQEKLNVIPYDTKYRIPQLKEYKQYQNVRIQPEVFEEWVNKGLFNKGMAIFPGRIYSDDDQSTYWVSIDLDSRDAINEFYNINGKIINEHDIAKKFVVEKHADNPDRAHIHFLSPIPFPNKGSDTKLGLEVKSAGEHGIMFICPSLHKAGYPYEILGTRHPITLTEKQAEEIIRHIDKICIKYDLRYIEKEIGFESKVYKTMTKALEIPDHIEEIREGIRNPALHKRALSLLFQHYDGSDISKLKELKTFFEKMNDRLCKPPLLQKELDSIWNSALTYVLENKNFNGFGESRNEAKSNHGERISDLIERTTEQIIKLYHFVTVQETKQILVYEDGVYRGGGDLIIEKEAENICGYNIANKHIVEIKGHIMRKTYHKRSDFDNDLDIINLQNGLYNFRKNILFSHNPEYLSVNQKPITFDPNAKSKLFGKFLKDVLYATEIRTGIEAMAYTFYRDCPFEYYFKLYGHGSNGKSVFTGLLTELHGISNVSNVPITSLVDNRFALADLENKEVNIDNEFSNVSIKDTSILKKLTGGRKQPIRIERKNQTAYDTFLYAKLFINTNSLKDHVERTNADYRREIILSFPNTFDDKNDDPNFLNKLITEEEISGIFNILMPALSRIITNNKIFLNEKTIEERRIKSERATDSIGSFIQEAVAEESTEKDWVSKSIFYNAYVLFCKKYKLPAKPIETLGKELKKKHQYLDSKKSSKTGRKPSWIGVKLNFEYMSSDPMMSLPSNNSIEASQVSDV